jgi:hypothetical protein
LCIGWLFSVLFNFQRFFPVLAELRAHKQHTTIPVLFRR